MLFTSAWPSITPNIYDVLTTTDLSVHVVGIGQAHLDRVMGTGDVRHRYGHMFVGKYHLATFP